MYPIVCFFPWFPTDYEYVVAFLTVFDISSDQLVSVRVDVQNHSVIISVESQAFRRIHQFFFRVLFFPLCDLNILECFTYPEGPQYCLDIITTLPDVTNNVIGYLSGFGTVLYYRFLCHTTPLTSDFRTDTLGVVLLLHLGYGQQVQTAGAAVPYVPAAGPISGGPAFSIPTGGPAVALQQPLPAPGYLQQQGTVLQAPAYLHQFQGQQVDGFRYDEAGPHCRYGHGNDTLMMGVSPPQKAPVKEKHGDERPSGGPKLED